MADADRCPVCGAELPPGAPPEACPRCVTRHRSIPQSTDVTGELTSGRPSDPDRTEPRDSTHRGPEATGDRTHGALTEPAPARTVSTDDRAGDGGVTAAVARGDGDGLGLPPGSSVRYFGDYEIRGELGRGGMGVVYEARQVSLNRPVALKMIRAGLLAGDDELRRFQNEAEAVALLDHPGVVPVYEVGEHEGQRYFSMKLVRGSDLAGRLNAYRDDFRASAALAAEVADAVHHAHMRGILHRDLKPANILIDADGHPHVTDFGLARRVEADALMTASGAVLGTPAYMSPEQAAGRRGAITTATDVHGLGAVLYALLAGRPPFAGDSVVDTLAKVRDEAPAAPRRFNGKVPRDLERVCLKALEKDPRRRYASAAALADDLRHWLAGEPVVARPVGTAARAWMWAKRKPVLASLSAALAASLVVGFAGMAALWREAVAQRNRAVAARDDAIRLQRLAAANEKAARQAEAEAVAATAQAEQNAQLAGAQAIQALNAVEDLINQVTDKLKGPGLFDLKEGLLKSALARVDGVAAVYDKSISKEAVTAMGLVELSRVYRQLGQSEKAYGLLQKAHEITKGRIIIKKGNDASRRNLAIVIQELAQLNEELNRDLGAAQKLWIESVKIYEDIDEHPMLADTPIPKYQVRFELSQAYKMTGYTYHRLGDMKQAADYYRKGYNALGEGVPGAPEDSTPDRQMVRRLYLEKTKVPLSLAIAYYHLGDGANAEVYYKESIRWGEAFLKREPNWFEGKNNLADVLYAYGETLLFRGDTKGARPYYERCVAIRKDMDRDDSKNAYTKRLFAIATARLGTLEEAEGHADAAKAASAEANRLAAPLAEADGKNDRVQMAFMNIAAHTPESGRAVEIGDRLAAGPRVDAEMKVEIARAYVQAARRLPPDQTERAQTLDVKAMEMLRSAIKDGYRDHVFLKGEPDLAPLRSREDFQALLREVAAPAR